MEEGKLIVENLGKTYTGGYAALEGVNFSLLKGQSMTVLGGSKSGKSTLLRLLAGLETPTAGHIVWEGVPLHKIPAEKRNIVLSLGEASLKKRQSVYDNLIYPLKIRGVPKPEADAQVAEAAAMFGIETHLSARVADLSAHKKSLVLLARCFVRKSGLVLLDDPLAGFEDAERRDLLAVLTDALKRQSGIVIYATDRIEECACFDAETAVLQNRTVLQKGFLHEIYQKPASLGVLRMLSNPSNVLAVTIAEDGQSIKVSGKQLNSEVKILSKIYFGKTVSGTIMPHCVTISQNGAFKGTIQEVRRHVRSAYYCMQAEEEQIWAESTEFGLAIGQSVRFDLNAQDFLFYDMNSERLISL